MKLLKAIYLPQVRLEIFRYVSVILLLAASLSGGRAADVNDLTWTTDAGMVTITDCDQNAIGELDIPNTIGGDPVVAIGNGAFSLCERLTNVIIPEGVTSIGDIAFFNCLGLVSVDLPSTLEGIGSASFSQCESLESVSIPAAVTSIGFAAFSSCLNLPSINVDPANTDYQSIGSALFNSDGTRLITFPAGRTGRYVLPPFVTDVEPAAFRDCKGLVHVSVTSSVDSIGAFAFEGCTSLLAIEVSSNNINYVSMDGVLFDASVTTLIQFPGGKCGSYTVPDSVETVSSVAFSNCDGLTHIHIPGSVKDIGSQAFFRCRNLESVWMADGVETVGSVAFKECAVLRTVRLGNTITELGEQAFFLCPELERIRIPASVTTLNDRTFALCFKLETVIFDGAPPAISGSAVFDQVHSGAVAEVGAGQLAAFGGSGADWNGLTVAERSSAALQTLATSNGTIGGAATVTPGGTATLSATAGSGYVFAHWTGAASGSENPLVMTVGDDTAVGAVFVPQATYDALVAVGEANVVDAPQDFDLFTADQLQALAAGMTIAREENGSFTLTLDMRKSTDLQVFEDMNNSVNSVTVNAEGDIELNFTTGDNAAFFKLWAE